MGCGLGWSVSGRTAIGVVAAIAVVACTATPDEAITFGGTPAPPGAVSGGDGGTDGGDASTGIGETGDGDGDTGSVDTGQPGPPADGTSDDGNVDGPMTDCTPGQTQPCYSGPPNTENVGECASGTATCEADGTWGACTGELLPVAEVCNALDDDCNAVVDDGNPGGGGACQTGLLGPCAGGTLTCTGGSLVCEPNVAPAAAETCGDGVDNDCNGVPDDTCAVDCDPMNPAPACGAAQQCMPSTTGDTLCQPTAGAGGQYSPCGSDNDCAPGHVCVDTGLGTVYCMQWCTSYVQCPYALDDCVALAPSVYAGLQEYGVCYDGFP